MVTNVITNKLELRSRNVPPHIKELYDNSANYFPTPLQQFVYFSKYSCYLNDEGRRETWIETVARTVKELRVLSGNKLDEQDYLDIEQGILNHEVIPSMRLMAMAGKGLPHMAYYNCTYMAINTLDCFHEAMLWAMYGAGVGYSVEQHQVDKLPVIEPQKTGLVSNIYCNIGDSTEGWVNALRSAIINWFDGYDVDFDYSRLRPAGTPLKRKGGRASGYEPLKKSLDAIRDIILARQGQKLRPIDCHDIMCWIASCSVCGGVRRTALISLFSWNDNEMLTAKSPANFNWTDKNKQRGLANNSVVWPERHLSQLEIMQQMSQMFSDGGGEPGIFSRKAARELSPKHRNTQDYEFGTNPCGEIILRDCQACNLSAVICRADDDFNSLMRKMKLATIIGTIQACALDFPGLRPQWRENCQQEALLGVDLCGHMDSKVVRDPKTQRLLAFYTEQVNEVYAEKLGINQSAAITCGKPAGNSSQLLDTASGAHARHAEYYFRYVRENANSPIAKAMIDAGVWYCPDNGQDKDNPLLLVFRFPVKSPDGAITRNAMTAVEQCEYWKQIKLNYLAYYGHNQSITISYKPSEQIELVQWIYDNQAIIGGMSFLPHYSEDTYMGIPVYQEISKKVYEQAMLEMPKEVDFSRIYVYELADMTSASQELACSVGGCETV